MALDLPVELPSALGLQRQEVVGCAVKFSDCRPAPRDFSGDSVDMKEVPIMQAALGS